MEWPQAAHEAIKRSIEMGQLKPSVYTGEPTTTELKAELDDLKAKHESLKQDLDNVKVDIDAVKVKTKSLL